MSYKEDFGSLKKRLNEGKPDKLTPAQSLVIFGLLVPSAIIRGFVLSILWTWFMVPLGVVSIGVAHAIGISALVGYFTIHLARHKYKNGDNPFGETLGRMLFMPFLILFFAYIIHLFM